MMPTVNQREVFERPPPGVRKIVLATNIAETRYRCSMITLAIKSPAPHVLVIRYSQLMLHCLYMTQTINKSRT